MEEKLAKLEELFKDGAAAANVFTQDADEILENLKAQGIELTEQEFSDFIHGFLSVGDLPEVNEELTEEMLENVAGGKKFGFLHGIYDSMKACSKNSCAPKNGTKLYNKGVTIGNWIYGPGCNM